MASKPKAGKGAKAQRVANPRGGALGKGQARENPACTKSTSRNENTLEIQQRELAQHLHDGLCQSLSGIQLMARLLQRSTAAGDSDAAAEHWKELHHCINQATKELQAVMLQLRAAE